MDWQTLETVKKKRKDNADKVQKKHLTAYEESEQAVEKQKVQHSLLVEQLQLIAQSAFEGSSTLSRESIDSWRAKVTAAQVRVHESDSTLNNLKKNSKAYLSQWHEAKACYQTALRKFEKCVEVRKEDDKYQRQARLLEDDRQLDDLPSARRKANAPF